MQDCKDHMRSVRCTDLHTTKLAKAWMTNLPSGGSHEGMVASIVPSRGSSSRHMIALEERGTSGTKGSKSAAVHERSWERYLDVM